MNLKLFFPPWILNTPVQVWIEEEGEAGPTESLLFTGKCNYDERARQVLTPKKELITLSGTMIFEGDLRPGQTIDGYVIVHGHKKQIHGSHRPKNPDGSVFSTELQLG